MPTVYDIRVRDASLNLVGEVDAYDKLSMVLRFNAVGAWVLSLSATHPMATFLSTRGYGIVVTRTILNNAGVVLNSSVILSGPMRTFTRENKGGVKTLTASGFDDLLWLGVRDAWPVTNFPLVSYINSFSPGGLWRLNETIGTTAADSSGNARSGTYTGGFTLNQATTLPDDFSGGSLLLDGISGLVDSIPAAACAGNDLTCIGFYKGTDAGALTTWSGSHALFSGAAVGTVNDWGMGISATGKLVAGTGNPVATATSNTSINDGLMHCVAFRRTKATGQLDVYVDGVHEGAGAVGNTNTLSAPTKFNVGKHPSGSSFTSGTFQMFAIVNAALTDQQVAQVNAIARNRFAYQAYDTQTGNAETVIRHYVDVNLGAGALGGRQVAHFGQDTNNNNGSTVTGNARFDNLLAKDGDGILQALALASSPVLGFRVTQSGTALTFSVYVPSDKTSNCIFSDDLTNLGDVTYEVEAPDFETGGNQVVVGGAGLGAARTFIQTSDGTSVANWGRSEMFLDKRDSSDIPTLTNAATSELATWKEKVKFSFQLVPQSALTYGIDFNLGDKVTCVLDGAVAVQDLVREVQIDLDPTNGEVVTPAVGSPGATAEPSASPVVASDTVDKAGHPHKGKKPKKPKGSHHVGHHHARHLKKMAHHHHHVHHRHQKLERRQ